MTVGSDGQAGAISAVRSRIGEWFSTSAGVRGRHPRFCLCIFLGAFTFIQKETSPCRSANW